MSEKKENKIIQAYSLSPALVRKIESTRGQTPRSAYVEKVLNEYFGIEGDA